MNVLKERTTVILRPLVQTQREVTTVLVTLDLLGTERNVKVIPPSSLMVYVLSNTEFFNCSLTLLI